MRVLIFFFALTLSFTTESQTVFKVTPIDSFEWGSDLSIMTEDRSYEEFMSVYLKAQELFDYNEVDQEQPLVDDSDGEYDISNMFDLYNTVEGGVNVELVYTLQATDKNYVAAHVFFDSDGYGIIVWAARQPDYDPRKIK